MARWMLLLFAVVAVAAAIAEARVIPAEPISVMLDAYGNPVMFLREKRTPAQPYPHRAMMFTSYYRPVRRNAGQATGVFAQGNAVSGQAFFGGMQPHLKDGPEPIEEPDVSSAEAHAAPTPEETYVDEQEQQPEGGYQPQHHPQEEHPYHDDKQHQPDHDHRDEHVGQEEEDQTTQSHQGEHHHEPEPEEAPADEPASAIPEAPQKPHVHGGKKGKKPPVVVDEDDEEEDEEEEDEPVVPFVPFKGNRRRQGYPNLNNFFPMVFSFPGVSTRAGSSGGSLPGAVTAIANSYSTGKSGVASSVATAYGGSPNGKKRRVPQADE